MEPEHALVEWAIWPVQKTLEKESRISEAKDVSPSSNELKTNLIYLARQFHQ